VLRKLQDFKVKPTVIVLTNHPNEQYRKRCAELGATYFFDKSTESEKVTEVLRDLSREPEEKRVGS
jgi:DNA-binding NarL/FixJ family response regulator